jgi:hypothetical protein
MWPGRIIEPPASSRVSFYRYYEWEDGLRYLIPVYLS